MNRLEKIIPEHLYNFSAGFYCGVFLPEKVMKKLATAHAEHTTRIKKILNENKDLLRPAHWTLANKLDESGNIEQQITIHYALKTDTPQDTEKRIDLFRPPQPRHMDKVYMADSHEQAKEIANLALQEDR